MQRWVFTGLFCASMSIGTALAGVPAPQTTISTINALPTPLPYPYDEKADAKARVSEAFARAKTNGKRVLIDFGGNWCADCRILMAVMDLPNIKAFLETHYEVVIVDVGRYTRNQDIVHRFGIEKLKGVPTVVIANADGTPLNITNSAELADARTMTPQGIANWLAQYAAP